MKEGGLFKNLVYLNSQRLKMAIEDDDDVDDSRVAVTGLIFAYMEIIHDEPSFCGFRAKPERKQA